MHGLGWLRIPALGLVAFVVRSARAQQTNSTATVVERSRMLARVATYRNAYGTHFQCTSTCYFTMWAYLACVAALLALLAAIPVQSPSKPENAPFVLWLGDNKPEYDGSAVVTKKKPKHVHGILDRLSMWLHGYEEAESSDNEDPQGSLHEDIDLLQQQVEPEKTFESIGVETDDSLLPPLTVHLEPDQDDLVVVENVDTLFDPLPPSPREKKPGIFSPVTPRVDPSKEFADADDTETTASRRRSVAPVARQPSALAAREPAPSGRRATVVGSAVSDSVRENLVTAVERRTSMNKRAEKRKEYAKSDIAHENLHEHELHMYEYLEFVRSLLEGIPLKKITQKGGKIVRRTFFITPNLVTVYWNQVGNKGWISKKSSIDSTEISHVVKGAEGNNVASKVKAEKHELCVTIVMNDGKRLVLEAKDAAMRERLFLGFSRLAVEKREEKRKRDAGELDDVEQDLRKSDEAEAMGHGAEQQQKEQRDGDVDEEDDEQKEENVEQELPETTAQHEQATERFEDLERRAKSEEDDPKRWRAEPQDESERVDQPGTNQLDQLEDAILVSDDDDGKEEV